MKKNTLFDTVLLFLILIVIIFGGLYVLHQQAKMQQIIPKQLVIITNSGSTNFSGYSLIVNSDGSGSLVYARFVLNSKNQNSKLFPKNTFAVLPLSDTLHQIGDVSKIPTGRCMQSVSFGSVTKITYNGKTSGDISCMQTNSSQIYKDLHNELKQIDQQALP